MAELARWQQFVYRKFVSQNELRPIAADELAIIKMTKSGERGPAKNDFQARALLCFRNTDGNFQGSVDSTWTSVRPSKLFINIVPEVWVYNPTTKREIAAALIERYGLPLEPTWFIDGPFDPSVMPQEVTLTTLRTDGTPASDELVVKVDRAVVSVSDVFTDTVLDAPGIPFTVLSGRPSAEIVYNIDFTPDLPEDYRLLLQYPKTVVDETVYEDPAVQLLVSLINNRPCDGEAAYDTGQPRDYSMAGSQAIYVGKPTGFVHPDGLPWSPGGNAQFDGLVVVKFPTTGVGRTGYGFFHFYAVS